MLGNLKEVEKFFKLCRKQGVTEVSLEGMTVKFGDLPVKTANQAEDSDEFPTDEPSPEEIMFYAVGNPAS